MALTDQRRTVRLPLPDHIVRNATHVIYAPVYLDGALDAPDAASTVSVYNASNEAVVDAATVTISGSIAQYSISTATTTSETLGEGWRVEWALTMSDGDVLTPRNSAALVRNGLWPVISDVDIIRAMPALDPSASNAISAAANYQGEIDEAWTRIQLRLIRQGNRPNLIMEPSALRTCHMALTMALIFQGRLASRLDIAYREQVAAYLAEYERAWSELAFRYDVDDDGIDEPERRPAMPSVWLSSNGPDNWRWS